MKDTIITIYVTNDKVQQIEPTDLPCRNPNDFFFVTGTFEGEKAYIISNDRKVLLDDVQAEEAHGLQVLSSGMIELNRLKHQLEVLDEVYHAGDEFKTHENVAKLIKKTFDQIDKNQEVLSELGE